MDIPQAYRADASALYGRALQRFANVKHTQRFITQPHKLLVLWSPFMGAPRLLGAVRFGFTRLASTGFEVPAQVTFNGDTTLIRVTHQTVAAADDRLFMVIPPTFEFELSHSRQYLPRIPLICFTEGSARDGVEGELIATQLSQFRKDYPQHKDLML